MNPEIKAKWVAALRSGEYKQGRGALKQSDEFCCLGVLYELAMDVGIIDEAHCEDKWVYDHSPNYPPREVIEWAQLESADPNVGYTVLSQLNDDTDTPNDFKQIADLIEKYL